MVKLPLVNIYNRKRLIYLFLRTADGKLEIVKDDSYHPYFYEPDQVNGKHIGYDGTKVKKIVCSEPFEIRSLRSDVSYESDIPFVKKYIIDRIDEIEQVTPKYMFLDIEVLCSNKEFPDPKAAKYPISSITIYNSKYNKIRNWYIEDYLKKDIKKAEIRMLKAFIEYLKKAKFDIWTSWNVDFDFGYLFHRFAKLPQKYFFERSSKYNNFASAISPIGKVRMGEGETFYPAGTSIVDYLGLVRKVYIKEASYKLSNIAHIHLGRKKLHEVVDFTKLSLQVKERNIDDVQILKELEDKFKLIPYYNAIRCFSGCLWEDLPMKIMYNEGKRQVISNNTKIIDMLFLKEAKQIGVVLPNKKKTERIEYQGALRKTEILGRHFNISQVDLDSAYPVVAIDFNLDGTNIVENPEKYKEQYPLIQINGLWFKQNPDAIIPRTLKKLVNEKSRIKKLKNEISKQDDNYDNINSTYAAIKAVVNSAYGYTANIYTRLCDIRIAATITYLVREALQYTIDVLKSRKYVILSYDTDSIMVEGKEDVSQECNDILKQWAKEKYKKDSIGLHFSYEGHYTKLFINGMCRYVGWLKTDKGIVKKVVGMETKRSDSSNYIKLFQDKLIDKLLNKESKKEIIYWLKEEIHRIKTKQISLMDISFPCKLSRLPQNYKNVPIQVRSLLNTQDILPSFKKRIGENYNYIYVIPECKKIDVITEVYLGKEKIKVIKGNIDKKEILADDEIAEKAKELNAKVKVLHKKSKVQNDVLALDEECQRHIKNVNWKIMIEKNVHSKSKVIFDSMGWDYREVREETPYITSQNPLKQGQFKEIEATPTVDPKLHPKSIEKEK